MFNGLAFPLQTFVIEGNRFDIIWNTTNAIGKLGVAGLLLNGRFGELLDCYRIACRATGSGLA